jgi:hypothetical protein
MDEQRGTTEQAVTTDQRGMTEQSPFRAFGSPRGAAAHDVEPLPTPTLATALSPRGEDEATPSQPGPSEEAPTASLVGSLSDFTLSDVLTLLASTGKTGEFQVAGQNVDGRLWFDHGALSGAHVGAATTMGQAVFELACVTDGWFSFSPGLVSSSGEPNVPVVAVLQEVRPRVDEWKEIRDVVPLEAIVGLSPAPPGQDVQIRSDQWQVLTTVGTSGLSVKAVLDTIGGDQITVLRTLRDLQAAGLIVVLPAPDGPTADEATPTSAVPSPSATDITEVSPPISDLLEEVGADDLANLPPPGDPVPAGGDLDDRFRSLAQVAMMPPPINADPWSSTAEPEANHSGVDLEDNGLD